MAEGGGAQGRWLNHSSARRGWRRGRGVWAVGEGVVANSAYGVAATFLPHKGGAVPESEKRRAAWCTTSTSHTCLMFRSFPREAVPSTHLLPTQARRGGRAGAGCGAVRACACHVATASVCIIISNEGALKRILCSSQNLEYLECSHQPHIQGRGAEKRTEKSAIFSPRAEILFVKPRHSQREGEGWG